ncbi:aspartate/glutamate racemase family protein [uncultured Tolumonas sp.]|uniref:aspartate/glutamate racemase family protein n=1 Tax=uncultured Tolumonas sp. TaxID=263765 RepID=UPI002A0A8289|nr:aspartate/glutamate racemase family protein [uncultured Tolumonas sp.]
MKTIGLIGGMSWQSTVPYYRLINEIVSQKLGGLHSAKLILWNMDFEAIASLQRQDRWLEAGEVMADAALRLQQAGAESIVICTNTMHKLVPDMQPHLQIPILHIADATAQVIRQAGLRKVGLLGTRFTMEDSFYVSHLREHYGLEVITPDAAARQLVHNVIFNELCVGEEKATSRAQYREIMAALVQQGAEGIIFGCTEIAMLVDQTDAAVPVFDTTTLHASYAAEWALA